MSDTEKLWQAVDAITLPTKRKLDRDAEAEWRISIEAEIGRELRGGFCSVPEYRSQMERIKASELAYGHIPPLWDQATWAVTTGSEQGGGGSSPLRERSPADLNLMETLYDIRETVAMQLEGRHEKVEGTIPQQMRHLASTIIRIGNPQHIDYWTYRFQSWTRLLNTYLNALDHKPRPVYLRNTACPKCDARQVVVDAETREPVEAGHKGETRVVPAIVINFTDEWVRAAQCQQCSHAWFRGDELTALAEQVKEIA